MGCKAVRSVSCSFAWVTYGTRRPTDAHVAINTCHSLFSTCYRAPIHSLSLGREGIVLPVRGFTDVDTLQRYPTLAPNTLLQTALRYINTSATPTGVPCCLCRGRPALLQVRKLSLREGCMLFRVAASRQPYSKDRTTRKPGCLFRRLQSWLVPANALTCPAHPVAHPDKNKFCCILFHTLSDSLV